MYHYYYEDTHMNHDCFNCYHSFMTDEDDDLHCPFFGIVYEDEWCEEWKQMAEFCKDCFLKLFGPVDEDEEIIESKEPWLCEGCEEWVPVVEIVRKKGN